MTGCSRRICASTKEFAGASIPKGNQSAVTIFTEFLDVVRFTGPEHEQAMEEYLQKRYRDMPPDVLIALGPEALDFWLARRDTLFPGTPVVFGGVGEEEHRSLEGVSGVTGLPMELSVVPVVESLLAMRPQTREIVLVHGAAAYDRIWRDIALRQCAPLADRVTIAALPEAAHGGAESPPRRAPRETPRSFISTTSKAPRAKRTRRPAWRRRSPPPPRSRWSGPFDTYIGTGVLGVCVSTFENEGVAIGELTRRVLSGERPESIGILPTAARASDGG